MREQIPSLKTNDSIIINLDDLDSGGSHWVACYCTKNLNLYFDSYGLPYPDELKQSNPLKKIQYNTSHFQPIDNSVLCGYYCIYFINELEKGVSYYDLLHELDMNDTKDNDRFISEYAKKLLK